MYLCSTLVSACDSYVESALKFNFQIKLIQQSKSSSLIHWVKLAFGIRIFKRKDVISIRYVKPAVWRSFRKSKNQRYFINLGRIYKIIPEINQSSVQTISIWNIFPEQNFLHFLEILYLLINLMTTPLKKRISSINVIKSVVSCGYRLIYWRIFNGKLHFLCSTTLISLITKKIAL